MSYQNKNFIVFGANGSIGSCICKHLSKGGANVYLVGRNKSEIENLANELNTDYSIYDARELEEVEQAFLTAHNKLGTIHGVVNAIGSVLLKPAHLTSENEWFEVLNTNLTTSFFILKSSIKYLDKEGGSILFFSTSASLRGIANHEAIASAKAGIDGLVRSAAATYAPKKIRINSIAPGLTNTKLTKRIVENESALKMSLSMHSLGRIGEVSDIASCALWLLNPENSWVSGQTIAVDGGLSNLYPQKR